MKREESYDRGMALRTPLLTSSAEHFNVGKHLSLTRAGHERRRELFVIKKTIRLRQANTSYRKIRHILIFDDHPDSLRLVSRYRANFTVPFSARQQAGWWDLIAILTLTIGTLIGMFWPFL